MKLLINYDFFDAIQDVNQPLCLEKVLRCNKIRYSVNLPLLIGLSYTFGNRLSDNIIHVGLSYGIIIGTDILFDYIAMKALHMDSDRYAEKAKKRLLALSVKLKDINVKTNYDMLLQSELYESKYRICLNEDKIPSLMQEKYILR